MNSLVRSRNALGRCQSTHSAFSPISVSFHSGHRSFHPSPTPRVYAEVIYGAHAFIDSIHSVTSLPWVAVLPFTAIIVRTFITLPLTIYTRKNTQKQWDLTPLMTAWSHQIRKDTMRQKGHLGPAVVARDAAKELRIKRRQIYRRWDCSRWKGFVPMVSLFVWLPVMETIRNMTGANVGILGLVMGEDGYKGKASNVGVSSEQATVSPESLVTDLPRNQNQFFEPTLVTEGGLWFPDLTASDPLLLLPFMLSASMFLNLMPSRRKSLNVPGATVSTSQRRLTNILKVMALAVGPLTLQMPAGMLIYWITSMTLGYIQSVVLDIYMPLRPPVLPCGTRSLASKSDSTINSIK